MNVVSPANKKHIELLLKIIAVLMLAVLFFLCFLLAQRYAALQKLDYISGRRTSWITALHPNGPPTASDTRLIQSWMTFDYVNHLFGLPPQYLKDSLYISDSRYPRVTLEEYAEDAHIPGATLLAEVQGFVSSFLTK